MAIEKLSVILELVSGNYKKEAREAANATQGIAGAAKSVSGSLGAMLGPAAIGGAVIALGRMAMAAGENADRLFDLQSQTGLSTDAIQEFEFVAKTAGATTEVFTDAVKAVIRNLNETEGATGAAKDAYEALGISVLDASGNLRDAGEITEETFQKLAGMEDITARNALAQDIFGKKWEETISVLDLGAEAIDGARQEARDLGVVLSGKALRDADAFRQGMEKLKASAAAAANQGLALIIPLLTSIAEEASDATNVISGMLGVIDKWTTSAAGNAEASAAAAEEADKYSSILDVLVPGITASLFPWTELNDRMEANAVATAEAARQANFMATAQKDNLIPTVFDAIGLINRQATAFSNAASAADTQRKAMINLANAQADLLDPLANVLRLQKDLKDSQERLTEVQEDSKSTLADLAVAAIEVEQAQLRLNAAGAALTSDQVQAFALVLINDLGMSEQQALDTLAALNLLDGWTGTASFTLQMNTIASGGGGGGNINTDIIGFAQGTSRVPGWTGQPQLVLAHGGETITPAGQQGNTSNRFGGNIIVMSPSNNLALDLQYGALLANHQTFGKF